MDSHTLAAIWSHIDQTTKDNTPTLKPVDQMPRLLTGRGANGTHRAPDRRGLKMPLIR